MRASFDVIVCGSLHLDIMVYAPWLPRLDETVAGSRWDQQCGGKGGNQAVMAARAGARTAMIGRVGRDDFGSRLLVNLTSASVDASAVAVDETNPSGMSVAIARNDGEYGAVTVSGANLLIDPLAIPERWTALGGAKALVLQCEIPDKANLAAARTAKRDGAAVIINAAPARPLPPELLDLADTLIVNRIEARMLSGDEAPDLAAALKAAFRLSAGRRNAIVTLGAEGAVVQPKGAEPILMPAKRVVATSAHGAGDCFVGALAARIAQGATLVDASRYAGEAAAEHVSRPL
jgi:ribokinase